MKTFKTFFSLTLILLLSLLISCHDTYRRQNGKIDLSKQEKLYYGIKINNVLCGYSEITQQSDERDGQKLLKLDDTTFVMLSALGSRFNSEIHSVFWVDSVSGRFVYQDNHIKQGPMDFTAQATVIDNQIIVNSTLSQKIDTVAIDPQVILRNNHFMPFLVRDFADSSVQEKTYRYFEIKDQEVQEITYRRMPDETLKLAGGQFEAMVFEEMNQKTGVKLKWWLDKNNGYILKLKHSRGETFLVDAGVADRIKLSKMDDLIVLKTNVSIGDHQGISYMKIKARLEPSGLRVTPQGLNVPGQKFSGTVTDNLIEGVFEIEHKRYNGADAPPFPADFSQVDSVREFLKATDLVEADDPVLVKKAQKITAGAKDSWEAAVRLSRWVADSIGYAIPGGLTARNTYDIRKGECGAHSILLAAFCRAVGIPARMVWGCMYVPNRGGSFGQHGWNEIYMGQAGWIPLDATAKEVDYVDSGHLRIGHFQSLSIALNPKEMEVLDYRVGSESDQVEAGQEEKYQPYLGQYQGKIALNVIVQNGQLTVDIPGKAILALNDPDKNGYWVAKASSSVFFEFIKDESGQVKELVLHELIAMPRKGDLPPEELQDVPDTLKPYLGSYDFQQANVEFKVFVKDGTLAIYNPLDKREVKFSKLEGSVRWKDEFNKNEIFFEKDANGKVKILKLDSVNRFKKK